MHCSRADRPRWGLRVGTSAPGPIVCIRIMHEDPRSPVPIVRKKNVVRHGIPFRFTEATFFPHHFPPPPPSPARDAGLFCAAQPCKVLARPQLPIHQLDAAALPSTFAEPICGSIREMKMVLACVLLLSAINTVGAAANSFGR